MQGRSKEVEAGWADEKQLLLGCSVANSHLPQQCLSEAFREGKSQSWEREATGKQYWRSQNLCAHGNLLIAMAGSCCAQRFQGGDGGSAAFPPRSPAFPLRHCCTGTCRQRTGSTRPGWQHRAVSGAGVRSRPLQVQGYAGNPSATLASTLPPSRLSCMLLPSSMSPLPFYPQCLRSMGTSDRDAAMRCHFHQRQWHSRHEAAWPPARGGLQPGGERVAGPAPARGKPGAWHAAKLTAAGCSKRRKG